MEPSVQKRLPLDTNVLFDLADRKDFAPDFREAYQRKGYALTIGPTVVAELYFFRRHGDAEEKRLASLALTKITSWDIQVIPLTIDKHPTRPCAPTRFDLDGSQPLAGN